MNFIENLTYKLLAIQERYLKYKLSKTLGVKHLSQKKKHFINGCTIDFSSLANEEKSKLEQELLQILSENNYDPKTLLNYITSKNTDIFITKHADKILNPIGENEGFILPTSGLKAIYLSLAIDKKVKMQTPAMFILSEGEINKYYFIYHFYNWFAYKHNIIGMDTKSQALLKKYLFETNDTTTLQLEDIYKLKDAIQQDKASIEFVIKICRNYDGAKQALHKIRETGCASL